MKVNFGNQTRSDNYAKAFEILKQDPGIVKRLLNFSMDATEQMTLARKLEVKFHDIQAMKKELLRDKQTSLTDGLDATVETVQDVVTVDMNGTHISVFGALLSGNKCFGPSVIKNTAVGMFLDLMTIEKNRVVKAPISTNKDAALVKIDPIVNVVHSFADADVNSRSEIRTQLDLNFQSPKASKVLTQTMIEIAPALSPMKEREVTLTVNDEKRKNKTKKVTVSLPVPIEKNYVEYDEVVAQKLLYKANQLSYPKQAPIHNTAARHVYGIPFAPQHRKYVDFLTDIRIPDEVKKVHMYSSDIVYAVALHNSYPRLKISIVGKRILSDDEIYLSYITPFCAKQERIKDKSIMGIWPVVEDKTQAHKKEKAQQVRDLSEQISTTFRKYAISFRPLNIHAVNPEKEYGLSVQVRNGIVIEGFCRGEKFKVDKLRSKVAAGIMHSYYFPFSWKSLIQCTKGYPPLLSRYCTLNKDISTKTKMFDLMKDFMKDSEADTFIKVCSADTSDDATQDDNDNHMADGDQSDDSDNNDDNDEDEDYEDGEGDGDEEEEEEELIEEDNNDEVSVTTGRSDDGKGQPRGNVVLRDNGNNNSIVKQKTNTSGGKKLVKAKPKKSSDTSILNSFLDSACDNSD